MLSFRYCCVALVQLRLQQPRVLLISAVTFSASVHYVENHCVLALHSLMLLCQFKSLKLYVDIGDFSHPRVGKIQGAIAADKVSALIFGNAVQGHAFGLHMDKWPMFSPKESRTNIKKLLASWPSGL